MKPVSAIPSRRALSVGSKARAGGRAPNMAPHTEAHFVLRPKEGDRLIALMLKRENAAVGGAARREWVQQDPVRALARASGGGRGRLLRRHPVGRARPRCTTRLRAPKGTPANVVKCRNLDLT